MFCLFRAHEKVTIYRSTAAAAVTPSRAVFLAISFSAPSRAARSQTLSTPVTLRTKSEGVNAPSTL